jgi:hypothetical protein
METIIIDGTKEVLYDIYSFFAFVLLMFMLNITSKFLIKLLHAQEKDLSSKFYGKIDDLELMNTEEINKKTKGAIH